MALTGSEAAGGGAGGGEAGGGGAGGGEAGGGGAGGGEAGGGGAGSNEAGGGCRGVLLKADVAAVGVGNGSMVEYGSSMSAEEGNPVLPSCRMPVF